MAGTSEGVRKAWEKRKRGSKNRMLKYWREYGRPETSVALKSGDTLKDIAKFYGVSVKQLIKENNINDVSQLVSGLEIRVPALKSRAEREGDEQQKAIDSVNKKKK